MMNVEYHKGSFCSYLSAFCREGYRTGCESCLKTRLYPQKEEPCNSIIDVRKSQKMTTAHIRS